MNYFDFYKHTINLLNEGRLLDALTAIQSEALGLGTDNSVAIVTSCAETLNTYRSLLTYFEKGVEDNGRTNIYLGLVNQALKLNEQLKRICGLKESQTIYYSKLRSYLRDPHGLSYFLNRLEQQRTNMLVGDILGEGGASRVRKDQNNRDNALFILLQTALFDYIWTTDKFTPEENRMLSQYFGMKNTADTEIDGESYHCNAIQATSDAEAAWMVSALTLSVLFYYDSDKWTLLQSLTHSTNTRIRVRARVGCALVVMNHKQLLSILEETSHTGDTESPSTADKIGIISTAEMSSEENCVLQWQFMVEYKTKFIGTSLNDTLNSVIARVGNKEQGLSEEQIQNMLESEDDDLPPGVDANTVRTLREEMMRTTNMMEEGIDTAYPQFGRFLQALPFFNNACNWLRPIDAADEADLNTAQALSPVLASTHLCSCDAYAFLKALNSVDISLRSFIDSQLKMMGSVGTPVADLVKSFDENTLAISYIRDIYRFFTLKMKDSAEGNPIIASPLMLFVNKKDERDRAPLASLCARAFSHRLYRHAVHLFEVLDQYSQDQEHTSTLSRIIPLTDEEQSMYAMSLALSGHNDDAIIHFETISQDNITDSAASIYANSLWSEGLYEDALKVYRKLYISNWEGLNLFDLGTKLYDVARYTEAATVLYKAHYMDASRPDVAHLLMLSLLRDRRVEEATVMCKKLLGMDLTDLDSATSWLKDTALCQLCASNDAEAIANLRRAKSKFSHEDMVFLFSYGIPQNHIRLIEDAANI